MKTPLRPFTVEIKRHGKRLVETPKPSIWPDSSIFRTEDSSPEADSGKDAAPREAQPTSVEEKPVQNAAPRILPDLAEAGDEDLHHRAKNPGGKTAAD